MIVEIIESALLSPATTMLTFEAKKSILVLSFLTPLSTVFVGLRLARKQKHLGVDDWVLCFALVLLYLQTVFGVLCKLRGRSKMFALVYSLG